MSVVRVGGVGVRAVSDEESGTVFGGAPESLSTPEAAESSSHGDGGGDLRAHETFREKLRRLLHSHRFHVAIVALVILDCLLVVVELLAEMRILELNEGHPKERHHSPLVHILHNLSIAILCIFAIEIAAKIYAFGIVGFLSHKLEVFDAFIVIVSLVLDIGFHDADSAASIGSGLIIVLRLWRVARILNGIILTVQKQAETKLEKEVHLREGLVQKLLAQRDYCHTLEEDNRYLRKLLNENGIEVPPPIEPIMKD